MGRKTIRKFSRGGDAMGEEAPLGTRPGLEVGEIGNTPEVAFGVAFRAARDAGDKVFTWRGKKYTTELAKESRPAPRRAETSSRPAPSRAAATSTTNIDDIRRRGAALRSALSGPPSTPAPRAFRPSVADVTATNIAGRKRDLSPEKREKLRAAIARSGTRSSGFAKGGSVDGCAVRGKTRAKRTR